MGAASPGAGPGEDTANALWPASHRYIGMRVIRRDRSSTCSLWPWKLFPEHVFVTSAQGRNTVPGLELETLNLSLPFAGCLTFVQTSSFWASVLLLK